MQRDGETAITYINARRNFNLRFNRLIEFDDERSQ